MKVLSLILPNFLFWSTLFSDISFDLCFCSQSCQSLLQTYLFHPASTFHLIAILFLLTYIQHHNEYFAGKFHQYALSSEFTQLHLYTYRTLRIIYIIHSLSQSPNYWVGRAFTSHLVGSKIIHTWFRSCSAENNQTSNPFPNPSKKPPSRFNLPPNSNQDPNRPLLRANFTVLLSLPNPLPPCAPYHLFLILCTTVQAVHPLLNGRRDSGAIQSRSGKQDSCENGAKPREIFISKNAMRPSIHPFTLFPGGIA